MTAPDPRLNDIQARLDAATSGPWFQGRDNERYESSREIYSEREVSATSRDVASSIWEPADAEFIAAAPTDVRYLLTELRKAHEALERVEAECRYLDTLADGDRYYAEVIRAAMAAAKRDEQ